VGVALTLLEDLAATHLVAPVLGVDGSASGERWRLHDLVRAFGVGVVKGDAGLWEEGEAARERVLAFYLQWAHAADGWLRWLPGMPESEWFVDRAGALAWLDSERAGLVAAVQWAWEERFADKAVWLSQCLAEYLDWRRSFDDWITVCGAAREVAHRAGNQVNEAIAWDSLGNALRETGQVEEAIDAHLRPRPLPDDGEPPPRRPGVGQPRQRPACRRPGRGGHRRPYPRSRPAPGRRGPPQRGRGVEQPRLRSVGGGPGGRVDRCPHPRPQPLPGRRGPPSRGHCMEQPRRHPAGDGPGTGGI
jgi:hypothetical protein